MKKKLPKTLIDRVIQFKTKKFEDVVIDGKFVVSGYVGDLIGLTDNFTSLQYASRGVFINVNSVCWGGMCYNPKLCLGSENAINVIKSWNWFLKKLKVDKKKFVNEIEKTAVLEWVLTGRSTIYLPKILNLAVDLYRLSEMKVDVSKKLLEINRNLVGNFRKANRKSKKAEMDRRYKSAAHFLADLSSETKIAVIAKLLNYETELHMVHDVLIDRKKVQVKNIRRTTNPQTIVNAIDKGFNREKIREGLENYKTKQKKIKEIREEKSKLRSGEKIKHLLEKNEAKKVEIQIMRDKLGLYDQVIGLSLNYLEKFSPSECPLCKRTITSKTIIRKLRQGKGKQKAESFTKSIERLDKSIEELEDELGDLNNLTEELEVETSEGEKVKENLRKLDIKTEKEASKILRELSAKISKAEKSYGNKETKLANVEKNTEELKLIHSILETRETKRNIDKLFPDKKKEITSLDSMIRRVRGIQKNTQNIMSICNKVSKNLADSRIKESLPKIAKFYSAFSHQYYKKLLIVLDRKKVRGTEKNTYMIKAVNEKDGRATSVSTMFSTGQMNCVALAIYLSMSTSLAHRLGFLILDDPSQTLDTGHKTNLVDKFKNIGKNTQLIISTQDSEFQKLLSNRISRRDRSLYNFKGWNKLEGPQIIKTW